MRCALTFTLACSLLLTTAFTSDVDSLDLLDQYVEHVDQGRRQHVHGTEQRGHRHPERFRSKRSVESYEVDEVVDEGNVYDDVSNVVEVDEITWTHSVSLDKNERVKLSWTVRDKDVVFKVEAVTRGYVGVGFSPRGDMEGADIVLGWVDDRTGKPFVVDCHGLSKTGAPMVDAEQNYDILGGSQNDTHTVLRFSRPWDTCDPHDMLLGSDTMRVIWAIYRDDPALSDDGALSGLNWHGEQRGTRSLYLTNPPPRRDPREVLTNHWDINLVDIEVPDKMDTVYWCKIFKVPPLKSKHHMIGYEPLLTGGHDGYVHHMILYECAAPPGDNKRFERYLNQDGGECYSPDKPPDWERCLTPIVAWAIGSQGEFLPKHVGLPLADGNRATYFMLEVHFDNPSLKKVRQSAGLRLHYTRQLRPNDGGIMVNGITVTQLHIIPPRQPEYRTAGYCNSQCTDKMLPQPGIKVISVVLHSHIAGKKLRLRHIRDGKELPRIAEDDHYDFNYQQARVLPQEVLVRPGDELVTECVYQTPNRTEPTFGGYSTSQEMCLAFVMYYPRTELAACYSMTPVKHFFNTFSVREFYNFDMDTVERMIMKPNQSDAASMTTSSTTPSAALDFGKFSVASSMDPELNERAIQALKAMKEFTVEGEPNGGLFSELVIKEPTEFRNKSFMSHLYEHPWDEMLLTQRIEESFYSGQHTVFCQRYDDTLAIPAVVFNFPNFTRLPEVNASHCQQRLDRLQSSSGSASVPFLVAYLTMSLIAAWVT